jgi:hypothetical protein
MIVQLILSELDKIADPMDSARVFYNNSMQTLFSDGKENEDLDLLWNSFLRTTTSNYILFSEQEFKPIKAINLNSKFARAKVYVDPNNPVDDFI